ncbi:hypothetical protein SDC9_198090 [bioreactor metagenome]|uniref:Uncharacterized protein n=1 Tax=bioreactor metagenome TaxID=1076179 RepID=A0A645ITH9_9ZZZZ
MLFDGHFKNFNGVGGAHQLGVFVFDLRQQAAHGKPAIPKGRVHLLGGVHALPVGNFLHKGIVLVLRQRDQVAAHLLFQHGFAFADVFFAPFFFKPVANFAFCFAGRHDRQPVAAGAFILCAGNDLDHFAGGHLVVNGHNAPVDLRPGHAVADRSVNGIGKVDHRCPRGQVDDIAFRGK